MTPGELLRQRLASDGARPLLTWYDDSSGDRVELSVATAANWAAKTANLLVEEHGLEPGDAVALDPPVHWLAVVVVLGAWTAGITVDVRRSTNAVRMPSDPQQFMSAVLPQPDALLAAPAAPNELAVRADDRELTLDQVVAAAGSPPAAARVMTTLPLDTVDGLLAAIVVPLVANGSCVLVAAADASRLPARADSERVTHTAGLELPGLPELLSG